MCEMASGELNAHAGPSGHSPGRVCHHTLQRHGAWGARESARDLLVCPIPVLLVENWKRLFFARMLDTSKQRGV